MSLRFSSRRKARYLSRSAEKRPVCVRRATLNVQPAGFYPVNDGVNQQMVANALEWLDVQPTDRVLDLFCGMGNFTLPLARRAASVVGVEGVEALVAKGRRTPNRTVCKM